MDLLKIRAEALRANLKRIEGHLNAVPDPRIELDELQTRLKTIEVLVRKSQNTVFSAANWTENSAPEVSRELSATQAALKESVEELKRVESAIVGMRKKYFRIGDTSIGREITSGLEKRIEPCIVKLDDIQADLRRRGANLQGAWDKFLQGPHEESQSIFAEYIEFLGGLALRDTGFDEGISRIAQELIQMYPVGPSQPSSMLAIPTRRQAVAMTLARIIRLTFPDWTIWALPSTAHEFWNIVAQENLKAGMGRALRDLPEDVSDTIETRFNDCLGDAFATYTMGPAYAFFAIFLLLNPSKPFTSPADSTADDVRACAICQMLERMDSKEPKFMNPPYVNVKKQLSAAWETAIAQTSAQPIIDEKEQINEEEQVAADKLRVAVLVNALWTTLTESSTVPPFTADVWNEIQTWVDPLVKGEEQEKDEMEKEIEKIPKPKGVELRHVLNAIWLARVHPRRTPKPKLDITDIAIKLSRRMATPELK